LCVFFQMSNVSVLFQASNVSVLFSKRGNVIEKEEKAQS